MPGDSDKVKGSEKVAAMPEKVSRKRGKDNFKFKPGPAKASGYKTKLRGIQQSAEDPLEKILDQHRGHRLRIARITFIIFGVMILVGLARFFYIEWEKEARRRSVIESIRSALGELDERLKQVDGYEKDKTALRAVELAEKGMASDISNYHYWMSRKADYSNIISERKTPRDGEDVRDFINATVFADMVHIPPGQFFMGKKSDEYGMDYERPRHSVIISKEFWIARTEITNSQLRRLFPNHKTKPWRGYRLDSGPQPAVKINWHTASAFCRMVTEKEKKAGRLPEGYVYRLPTEAEWEYACRAGTDTVYYWGDEFGNTGGKYANAIDIYSIKLGVFKIRPLKNMAENDGARVNARASAYRPNAFGLHNMLGNASEWCLDWYAPKAYKLLGEVDPVQLNPVEVFLKKTKPFDSGYFMIETPCRVLRGGNYGNLPGLCRCAARDFAEPDLKNTGIGFRMVLAPAVKKD
jgi:formylglycine-generating enzyme required for sulfatase activity